MENFPKFFGTELNDGGGRIGTGGITLIQFITGQVDRMLAAYAKGQSMDPDFVMPGCHADRDNHIYPCSAVLAKDYVSTATGLTETQLERHPGSGIPSLRWV